MAHHGKLFEPPAAPPIQPVTVRKMHDDFDPYYQWLGIGPEEQPPSHYRLLGIHRLESNHDVIAHAADRQMTYLRTLQAGRRGDLVQRLLGEVAAARLCLLDNRKKAAYDAALGNQPVNQSPADKKPATNRPLPVPVTRPPIPHDQRNRPPGTSTEKSTGGAKSNLPNVPAVPMHGPPPGEGADLFSPLSNGRPADPLDVLDDVLSQSDLYGNVAPNSAHPPLTGGPSLQKADSIGSKSTNPVVLIGIAAAIGGVFLLALIVVVGLTAGRGGNDVRSAVERSPGDAAPVSPDSTTNHAAPIALVSESQSQANLRQISLALHSHHDVFRRFPPAYSATTQGEPKLSWRVHLLPFVDELSLYNRFDIDKRWDEEPNKSLIDEIPAVYRSFDAPDGGKTCYLSIRGPSTVFPVSPAIDNNETSAAPTSPSGVSIGDIVDGLSNTVAVIECDAQHAVEWTRPDDYLLDSTSPRRGLGTSRGGGFLALMCDANVRRISISADAASLNSLFNRNDGRLIPNDVFVDSP